MEQFITQNFTGENFWTLLVITLWTLPWKGIALWKSARRKEQWWFIALLVIHTLGILEILYIFIFSKRKEIAQEIAEGK
jgi:methionyl-tRNA synthetase